MARIRKTPTKTLEEILESNGVILDKIKPKGFGKITFIDNNGNEHVVDKDFNIFEEPPYKQGNPFDKFTDEELIGIAIRNGAKVEKIESEKSIMTVLDENGNEIPIENVKLFEGFIILLGITSL